MEKKMLLVEKLESGVYVPNKDDRPAYLMYNFLKKQDVRVPKEGSDVVKFLNGKNIFITGATGFLGKLLVEKLLRAAYEEVDTIYILVRPKKGVDFAERIKQLFKDEVFSELFKIHSDASSKIVGIKGDVSEPGLGMSEADRQLLVNRVNMVFHVAATTRFNEKMSLAVAINIMGTKSVVQLAKEMKNLVSFVYVSTAFSNCNNRVIEEKFYAPNMNPDYIIEVAKKYTDDEINLLLPKILGDMPNSYTFTKQIAEDVIRTDAKGLPVCVFRPAVVTPTYKEPLKGWTDNVFGPVGIAVGAGLGVIRVYELCHTTDAPLIPADYVTNACIASAYKTAMERITNSIPIYNYSSSENSVKWTDYQDMMAANRNEIAMDKAIWCLNTVETSSQFLLEIYWFLLHTVPGIIFDLFLTLTGKEPMLLKAYRKIRSFYSVIHFFQFTKFDFDHNNTTTLWNFLNENDRKIFQFDVKNIDWSEYFKSVALGIRIYILKDPLTTFERAMRKARWFRIAQNTLLTILALIGLRILYWFIKLYVL